jgi:aminoglycoside phosphotransferase (APT) family kinase protein
MARALDTLDKLAQEPAPAHLGALAARRPALMSRWDALLADPQMPARAGVVVSPEQLRQLHAQASALNLDGPHVVHLDVRSDNLLLDDEAGRAVLLDWNWSVRGNRDLDLALLAVRTEAEGGPHPDDIAPAARPFASLLCGMWMQALADSTASDERQALQRGCLRAALRWALA